MNPQETPAPQPDRVVPNVQPTDNIKAKLTAGADENADVMDAAAKAAAEAATNREEAQKKELEARGQAEGFISEVPGFESKD